MSGLLNVSSSPHVRSQDTTQSIMFNVAIALVPASAFGILQFGLKAFLILLVSVASCILTEYTYQNLMGKPVTISDGSAIVTGLLLGLNLPSTVPLWIPFLGGVFAILIVKQLFGGLGQNFMNPALAARCFLLISFTSKMTLFELDGVTGATPLAILKNGGQVDVAAMFVGRIPGTIGEVSVIALLLGAAYLLIKRVISLRIPLTYIGTFAIVILLFGEKGSNLPFLLAHLCGGGLIMGAFFMATDYVTSPITKNGQYVFGICLGILTGIFRIYGKSAEGVSYAIIFCNLLVPLIERVTLPTAFGKKIKSSINTKLIIKNASILLSITLAAGLFLGLAYEITKAPIEKQKIAANLEAHQVVFPDAADFGYTDALNAAVKSSDEIIASSGQDFGSVVINEALEARDALGTVLGYIVTSTSKDGYGGNIVVSVGVDLNGTTTSIELLEINETAGVGMKAADHEFKDQFKDKSVTSFVLTGKKTADNEIDSISGATITSEAVTNAVNSALYFISSYGAGTR